MESTDQRAERRQNVVVPHESELAVDECDGLAALVIEAQSARSTVDSLRFQVTQQSLDRCRLPTWGSSNRIADPHDVSHRTAFKTHLVGHGSPPPMFDPFGTSVRGSTPSIHPSAWNMNSRKFAHRSSLSGHTNAWEQDRTAPHGALLPRSCGRLSFRGRSACSS